MTRKPWIRSLQKNWLSYPWIFGHVNMFPKAQALDSWPLDLDIHTYTYICELLPKSRIIGISSKKIELTQSLNKGQKNHTMVRELSMVQAQMAPTLYVG